MDTKALQLNNHLLCNTNSFFFFEIIVNAIYKNCGCQTHCNSSYLYVCHCIVYFPIDKNVAIC